MYGIEGCSKYFHNVRLACREHLLIQKLDENYKPNLIPSGHTATSLGDCARHHLSQKGRGTATGTVHVLLKSCNPSHVHHNFCRTFPQKYSVFKGTRLYSRET